MKKKILIVISNLEFGGAQRQLIELANNLNRDQYDVDICSLSNYVPLAVYINPEIQLHVVEKKAKFDATVVWKLIKLIRKNRYHIIHSYLFDAEIAARIAGKLSFTDIKIIGSERNADYSLKKIQKLAYRITRHMVDMVIANSHAGAKFNERSTGVAAEKYHVIHNGVDTERFRPRDKKECRDAININSNEIIVGMFASFKQQKNHPLLLEAVRNLEKKHPTFKILFVGEQLYDGMHGSDIYAESISEMIDNFNIKERCIMLGNRQDVESIYPACDFTVLPSLFEGTPNVLLESMACGVPVVATRVSDNEIIVDHQKTGLLLQSENVEEMTECLDSMLSDAGLRERMSQASVTSMINNFSSHVLAEKTAKIYDSLCSNKN